MSGRRKCWDGCRLLLKSIERRYGKEIVGSHTRSERLRPVGEAIVVLDYAGYANDRPEPEAV
jgi:hypothetical protein